MITFKDTIEYDNHKYPVFYLSLAYMIDKFSITCLALFGTKIKDWCISVTINAFLAIIKRVVCIAFENVYILSHLVEDIFF
jgi:hypothetical protein